MHTLDAIGSKPSPGAAGSSVSPPAGSAEHCRGPTETTWQTFREWLLENLNTNQRSNSRLRDMVTSVAEMAQHTLAASSCTVILENGHGHTVFYHTHSVNRSREVAQARTDTLDGPAAWVVRHKRPVMLNEASDWSILEARRGAQCEGPGARILCVPLDAGGHILGALELTRHKAEEPFSERDLNSARMIGATAGITFENSMLRQSVEEGYRSTIRALASAIDAKDPYTCGHSQHVAQYSMVSGFVLNLDADQLQKLETAAILHDIGKIGINDAILRKPRKLSTTEHAIVKHHPVIGAAIIHSIDALHEVIDLILHHHENYDGTGYPHGLKGESIPLGARIIGVADAFDSMTTDRPYRRAFTINEAMTELLRCRSTQFCPQALDAFAIGFSRHYSALPWRPRVLEQPDRLAMCTH